MFKGIVQKYLKQVLGEYIEDFNPDNVNIAIWKGEAVVKDIKLKKDALKKMNLPFDIKHSRLKCLTMNIPWSNLSSSKIMAIVDGLQITINEIPEQMWQCKDYKIIEKRKKQIHKYCESIISDFTKKIILLNKQSQNKQNQEKGYFANILMRILDNVQVTVKDIHIRFQDEIKKQFSFGATLEQFKICTVNSKDEPQFVDRTKAQLNNQPLRKKLFVSNFGIYWDVKSSFSGNIDLQKLVSGKQMKQKRIFKYIILFSSTATLTHREKGKQFHDPQIDFSINLDKIPIQIQNKQLQQIVNFSERIQKFLKRVKNQNKKKLNKQQFKQIKSKFFDIFPNLIDKKCSQEQTIIIQQILEKVDVQIFFDEMKFLLQKKQKEKLMKQKQNNTRGWFQRPRELSEQQVAQIEKFLIENFGKETNSIKRPHDYYYKKIRVKFNFLSIKINSQISKKMIETVILSFNQLNWQTALRQEGHIFNFSVMSLSLDLQKKKSADAQPYEIINVIQTSKGEKNQFADLVLIGKPIDDPDLDIKISIRTQQLLIKYHPNLVQMVLNFLKIKTTQQNQDAIYQSYGQMKQLAEKTVNQSFKHTYHKNNSVYIDVCMSCINVLFYFDPTQMEKEIWSLKFGSTKIYSDPKIAMKKQVGADEPIQSYQICFSGVSFTYFDQMSDYIMECDQKREVENGKKVIQQIQMNFQVQLFKNKNEKVPKLKINSFLHSLKIDLTQFTYTSLQNITECFKLKNNQCQDENQQPKLQQENNLSSKQEIIRGARKIGIVYEQQNEAQRYIAVLNKSFLYLYKDKKDIQYLKCYYLKKCRIECSLQAEQLKKSYEVKFINSVNTLILGFDKQTNREEWINSVKDTCLTHQQSEQQNQYMPKNDLTLQKKESSQKYNPNNLLIEIQANVSKIQVSTKMKNSKQIKMVLKSLDSSIKLYEAKNIFKFSLLSIFIQDNFHNYKFKQLNNFLYSIQGKEKLIYANITNLKPQHPKYRQINFNIDLEFGKLVCNYKTETVEKIIQFYSPKNKEMIKLLEKQYSEELDFKQEWQIKKQKLKIKEQKIQKQIRDGVPQRFLYEFSVKIQEIAISFINNRSKVLTTKFGISGVEACISQSIRRLMSQGSIKQLWAFDYSDYPYTIHQEQQSYDKGSFTFQSVQNNKSNMIQFDVQKLQIPNSQQKSIFVLANICNIKVSYIQQQIMRIVHYIQQQLLPSLSLDIISKLYEKKLPSQQKPMPFDVQLNINIDNTLIVIEPRSQFKQKEFLQLNLQNISITNSTQYRQFLISREEHEERTLITNYDIQLQGINIVQEYRGKKKKLTNNIKASIKIDYTQNPGYYRRVYGSRFQQGIRVDLDITPFLLCMNHDDFNFIMKCMFWNVTYDDNAEGYFTDQIAKQKMLDIMQIKQLIYFNLHIPKIVFCVTQERSMYPLYVLLLCDLAHQMTYHEDQMDIKLIIKHIYATNIIRHEEEEQISIERGMINLFGYEEQHFTKDLYEMDKFIDIFGRNEMIYEQKEQNVVLVKMIRNKITGLDDINAIVNKIGINIDMKSVYILSKLLMMQDFIEPPKSEIKPILFKVQNKKSRVIHLQVNNLQGCIGDKNLEDYIVMQGNIYAAINMNLQPPKEIIDKLNNVRAAIDQEKEVNLANYQMCIRNFSLYFCNICEPARKRYVLTPLNVQISVRQFYQKNMNFIQLCTETQGNVGKISIQCSVRDVLLLKGIISGHVKDLFKYIEEEATRKQKIGLQRKQSQMSESRQKLQSSIIKNNLISMFEDVKIINKRKIVFKLLKSQLKIINNCQQNFMPVLNFTLQQSNIIYGADDNKSLCTNFFIFKLEFFNPRSAYWQPIIQTFQLSFDYITKMTEHGLKRKIFLSSSQNTDLNQLKFNLSTQFVTTLLATIQTAKNELKNCKKSKIVEHTQVSPYIIQNKSNYSIQIFRQFKGKSSDIQVAPMFKGPLKLTENAQSLTFACGEKKFKVSMKNFGCVSLHQMNDLHLEFGFDKLKRTISFVSKHTIKNQTNRVIYCARLDEKYHKIGESVQIYPFQSLPIQGWWYIHFSFNRSNYTNPIKVTNLRNHKYLKIQSEHIKLAISQQVTVFDHNVISIRAPFQIQNCLPMKIQLKIKRNKKADLFREIPEQQKLQIFEDEDLQNVKFEMIGSGYCSSEQFWIDPSKFEKQQMLYMHDTENRGTGIRYIIQNNEKKTQLRLVIYCNAFILSELQQDIIVYGSLEQQEKNKTLQKYYMLAGQTQNLVKQHQYQKYKNGKIEANIVLIGGQVGSRLRVCGVNCNVDLSQPFSINNIQLQQARTVVERQVKSKTFKVFTTLGFQIKLKKMSKYSGIFSKQIIVKYRYVVINSSPFNLMLRQYEGKDFYFTITNGERKPLFYGSSPTKIIIQSPKTKESFPVLINSLGVVYFRLELKQNKNQYIYFSLNTQEINSQIFFEVKSVNYNDLPYQVIVKSSKFMVQAPQYQRIITKNSQPFCTINQIPHPYNLFLTITFSQTKQQQEILVQADNLSYKKILRFYSRKNKKFITCMIRVIFNDLKKLILIQQITRQKQKTEEYEISCLQIKLQKISVSFIQNHVDVKNPYEAFYFYMQNIDGIRFKTNLSTKYQTRVQLMQFDQQYPSQTYNPVILTPYKHKPFVSSNPKDNPEWVFNALAVIDNNFVRKTFFSEIKLQINDLVLRANTHFVKLLMSMVKQYNEVFRKDSQFKIKKQQISWRQQKVPEDGSRIHINNLSISPFTIQVSAQLKLKQFDFESIFFYSKIINALGLMMTNIEHTPIKFDGIQLTNCTDSVEGLKYKIAKHYKSSTLKQIYKIFGSLNIIGSPMNLFRNIASGAKAFRDKPAQGFVKGPLQFGLGVVEGTSSLIARSVGGVFNSVEKVTGTFATGLSFLAFDKQFQEQRERQKMRKPQHIGQGLTKGSLAIFKGFKQGITGVITKPIQQSKKSGVLGFFKGAAQGVAGLVVKPTTGVIDFVSSSAQGMKNTALYLQQKPNENRIRLPRTLYTDCFIIQQYDPVDSKLYSIVKNISYNKKYNLNIFFVQSFVVNEEKLILVLKEHIMMVNISYESIEWATPLQTCTVKKISQQSLKIVAANDQDWYTKNINFAVELASTRDLDKLVKLVSDLKYTI